MPELLITRGLPASGKSSFAKAWVAEDPSRRVRVNRDDTRAMVQSGVPWSRDLEDVTTTVCHAAIRALLRSGRDVVVDDTNLNGGNAKRLSRIAAQCGADFTVKDFPISVEDAIARDAVREHGVGEKVIRGMHDRYLAHLKGGFPAPPTLIEQAEPVKAELYTPVPGTSLAVIVDIDGTLAHNYGHRSFYDYSSAILQDAVHQPIVDLCWQFITQGYDLIIMSGRDDSCRDDTIEWLSSVAGLSQDDYVGLFMRATGDKRDDGIVKLELFDQNIRDHYDVRYVLDDRNRVVKAWRSIGLTVLQVADGEF